MFVRDPMTLAVVVEARGLRDAEATIVLEAADQRRRLGAGRRLSGSCWAKTGSSSGRRSASPQGRRPVRIPARVEDAGPELTQEDNVATAAVKVVRQQIRVLLIAGSPSPEVQFLRNALMRDQRVEFAAWLQHADPGFRQPGDRPDPPAAQRHRPSCASYDALLLVDPDLQALGPQWPEMITHFVGQEGGGLIFVAGELYSQQLFEAADAKAAGGELDADPAGRPRAGPFPDRGRGAASARQSTYTLELTPEGRGDPVFEFNADPIRNRAILTSLPGMYWSFPVTRARPGATVLATHGDPRMQNQYGRQVLLASQLYGPGRTVFIGFDSTYRWRYLSEDYFDGFWARLVDRVGRNKALGGRFPFQVHLGKSVYRVGDQVSVGVRYTEAAALAEAAELAAELEIAGQPPEPLRFEKVPDDPGLLTATFPAQQAGAYSLRIVPATAADRRLGRPRRRPPRFASSRRDARSTSRRSTGRC